MKTTLETGGEDVKTTLETSGKDHQYQVTYLKFYEPEHNGVSIKLFKVRKAIKVLRL